MKYMINPDIFRAYDIRALVPQDLDGDGAYNIGLAFAAFLKKKNRDSAGISVLVQSDMRESSPELKDMFIKGLIELGINIIDGGVATTPMHYFSIQHSGVDAGVIVTASHNPAQYNGFKLSLKNIIPVGAGTGMEETRDLALSQDFKKSDNAGTIEQKIFQKEYIKFLLNKIDPASIKKFRIAIDAGNGMAGLILPNLITELPIDIIPLYFDTDMSFPNHEANPMNEKTLGDLKKCVINEKADFGIAFDGDADRLGFIDEKGQTVANDLIASFMSEQFLKKDSGANIVYDLRSSRILPEIIEKQDGHGFTSKVGHSFIKSNMRKNDAIFGAELAGHFYFKEFFFADSAMLAFLYFLQMMSQENDKLSKVIERYKKYYSSGEINFEIKKRDVSLFDKISEQFSDAEDIFKLDGLSIKYKDWWFNIRMSNTEPLVRLTIEAIDQDILNAKTALLKEILKNFQ
ncbi:phosphomannomutase/phosphoglucomutase [Patescibacteria group bacterium]